MPIKANESVLYQGVVFTAVDQRGDRWLCDVFDRGQPQRHFVLLDEADFRKITGKVQWAKLLDAQGIKDAAIAELPLPIWVEKEGMQPTLERDPRRLRRRAFRRGGRRGRP